MYLVVYFEILCEGEIGYVPSWSYDETKCIRPPSLLQCYVTATVTIDAVDAVVFDID